MIKNAAKHILENEKEVYKARTKTESIPFKLLNQFLKFFSQADLQDDDLKNFELYETV